LGQFPSEPEVLPLTLKSRVIVVIPRLRKRTASGFLRINRTKKPKTIGIINAYSA
jgi:hypothetical protein